VSEEKKKGEGGVDALKEGGGEKTQEGQVYFDLVPRGESLGS